MDVKFIQQQTCQSYEPLYSCETSQMASLNFRVFTVGRTGAVVRVADYGPRGPWFETWPRHSLLWP